MLLVDKKKINYNNKELYIDIYKNFDAHCTGKDYYTYSVEIYKKQKYITRFFNKEKIKFILINSYKTYWLNYFKYYGNIDKVLKEAFEVTEREIKAQEDIKTIEKRWK